MPLSSIALGITRALWRRTLETASEFHFQSMAVEASTLSTRKVCRALGFDEVVALPYDEFLFEGRRPLSVLGSDPEFSRLAIYERQIMSNLYV